MRTNRNVLTVGIMASLLIAVLFAAMPTTALAQSAISGATVELWNDSDGDGAFGGALDTLIDSTTTDGNGLYTIDADGSCDGCAIVISGWGPADDSIDHVGGKAIPDATGLSTASATLWTDDDGDGVAGSAGDTAAANVVLGSLDDFEVAQADCTACAIVIEGWGPADDSIDTIIGIVNGWGPADDSIDGWGPSGDDIDQDVTSR